MRLHYLRHETFEGLGNIEAWARSRGYEISSTPLFNNGKFPQMDEFDFLVIMGGSMNIYEEEKYPWLVREKKFIKKAIDNRKIVLGVCLGAQLIADVLVGKVRRNRYREIGWFPVRLTNEAKKSHFLNSFPEKFTAFHWHSDTFDIPPEAIRIAESGGCKNQAFEYGKVVGLQFHLEYSLEGINLMFQNCSNEIIEGKYIRKQDEILSKISNIAETQRLLNLLLDNIERVNENR